MSDEADLDALIAKIHTDLRTRRRPPTRIGRLRAALGRGRVAARAHVERIAAKWLVPAGIVIAVGLAVVLSGRG